MNLRSTAWLFALMFSMLWLFGLMLAFKKNPLDKAYVLPSLQAARDYDVVSVTIQRKPGDKDKGEPQEFQFTQENDVWKLKDPGSSQAVKVESFRVNDIVNQVKNARKDEEADVTNDLARFGLDRPQATVTIKGKRKPKAAETKDEDKDAKDKKEAKKDTPAPQEKEWKAYLGKESADKKYVYMNSSDEPNRVFAVVKSSLDSLFIADPNHLRSKTLFTFSDATAKIIEIKQGATELELKKGDDGLWRFAKPALGYADFEGPPPPKELPPGAKAPAAGVKGLINTLSSIRIDSDNDFVPLSKDNLAKYQLEDGKEALRIQVSTADFKKEISKETLLVGKQDGGSYYARLANDEGVFKLPAKLIDPVVAALKDPGSLRSLDVAQFDPKTIDAIKWARGKSDAKIWHPDGKAWQIQVGGEPAKKGNEQAIPKMIEALLGKRQIQRFHDATDAEAKKLDAELGLDAPTAEIELYAGALEKKDEGKDKKDDKKDEKKESKAEEKKETKQEESFALKKGAEPVLTLKFGKADKDTVAVLRVTADGKSRFVVPKSLLDAAAPAEGALAFLDPALPSFESTDVVRLELQRGGKKLELEKGTGTQAGRWLLKEGQDKADQNLADPRRTDQLLGLLSVLPVHKVVKRVDAKDDLDEYGLKTPALTATVHIKKAKMSPEGAADLLAMFALPHEARPFVAAAAFAARQQAGKAETIVIPFGKESADKDVYAKHSGSDLLFTVPADLVKMFRELDLRDKTLLLATEPVLGAGAVGAPATLPLAGVLTAAPVNSGQVATLDPAKVKEIRLAVRTPYELREFAFQRKDKAWTDLSGLKDFNLDADKVEQLIKDFGRLRAERFISLAGGPKTDQKLGAKDFTAKVDLVGDDGKTVTITVGAPLERAGYFAHASSWPEAVFLVGGAHVDPLMRGVGFFAKERAAE